MPYSHLPEIDATLNAISAILLFAGWRFIRAGRVTPHKRCMISAFITSTLFLICYVIYHAHIGSKPFPGHGVIRIVYFSILIPHVILAAVIVPMVIITLSRALRERFDRHRAIARWTLPLWLFVSVSCVVVYLMLYQLY